MYEQGLTAKVAHSLAGLGVKSAMVVHSFDGMDEISTSSPTQVAYVKEGEVTSFVIQPEDYGFARCSVADYLGGKADDNAGIILRLLNGEHGPKRDVVLINAAAALVVAGVARDIREGLAIATDSIDSRAALAKLESLKKFTQSYQDKEDVLLS